MLKVVYEIDDHGFVIESYVAEFDEEGNMSEVKVPVLDDEGNPVKDDEGNVIERVVENLIPITMPHGLYRAKWTGEQWVEGATQEEIDEMTKHEPSPPTENEQRLADLELIITELLMGGI